MSHKKMKLSKKVEKIKQKYTPIARPISTDANKTPKKAPVQARKSILSTFQISRALLRSISPGTAERIIAARIAFGVKYKSPVKNLSDMRTVSAITMFDTIVSEPAL